MFMSIILPSHAFLVKLQGALMEMLIPNIARFLRSTLSSYSWHKIGVWVWGWIVGDGAIVSLEQSYEQGWVWGLHFVNADQR